MENNNPIKESEKKSHNIVIRRTFEYGVTIEALTKKEAIEKAQNLQVDKTKWHEREKEYITENKWRTEKQNNAVHKYFSMLTQAMNENGVTVQQVTRLFAKQGFQMDVTPNFLKEQVWKPIQKALFGTNSTRDLRKDGQIEKIHDTINLAISQDMEIYIPFPSKEIMHYEKIAAQEYEKQN